MSVQVLGRPEISTLVLDAYKLRYPDVEHRVTDIVLDTFSGNMAVVRSKMADGPENEEICYVYPEGTVKIFSTTEELVSFLEARAKEPLLNRLFTRPILSGMIFAFLLVAVFIIGFSGNNFRPEALSILGSVIGVAAGFFFGSRTSS